MKPRAERRVPLLRLEESRPVQSVLLRGPPGPSVRHLLLRVPEGRGADARMLLTEAGRISFGVPSDPEALMCSIGFTFAGLEALRLPLAYLRVFQRLAPSFRTGAVRRSAAVGDGGLSSATHWGPGFVQERAHVIVSWHGPRKQLDEACTRLRWRWRSLLRGRKVTPARPKAAVMRAYCQVIAGEELGAPPGEQGQWAHFGFRDDVSDLAIDENKLSDVALDLRYHAPGALLLGRMDDEGLNRFSLTEAPDKVRRFFRDSSFGILRVMEQDLASFEAQVAKWQEVLCGMFETDDPLAPAASTPREPAHERFRVDKDFVKAKLSGRWPAGQAIRPGATCPPRPVDRHSDEFKLKLYSEKPDGRFVVEDAAGLGCPFGSHVRRMQGHPDHQGHFLLRPLLRRSVPFGSPSWDRIPLPDEPARGHLGHFFCASIENQFEHLLGQWGARPPIDAAAGDDALDPLMGPHDDPSAGLLVPLEGKARQRLTGFRAWTRTLGMAYAWYPGDCARKMLFEDDFVPVELAGPWL